MNSHSYTHKPYTYKLFSVTFIVLLFMLYGLGIVNKYNNPIPEQFFTDQNCQQSERRLPGIQGFQAGSQARGRKRL